MSFTHIADREIHESHVNVFYDLSLLSAIAFIIVVLTFAL